MVKRFNSSTKLSLISFFLLAIFLVGNSASPLNAQTTSTDLSGFAWSSNIGWISFNSTDSGAGGGPYKVSKDNTTGALSGFAWSPNVGWIQFGGLSGFPNGGGTQAVNAQAVGTTLVGWARAVSSSGRTDGWDGWISLSGSNYGVLINNNRLTGYAWGSGVVGWIHFGDPVTPPPTPTTGPGPTGGPGPTVCLGTCPTPPPATPSVDLFVTIAGVDYGRQPANIPPPEVTSGTVVRLSIVTNLDPSWGCSLSEDLSKPPFNPVNLSTSGEQLIKTDTLQNLGNNPKTYDYRVTCRPPTRTSNLRNFASIAIAQTVPISDSIIIVVPPQSTQITPPPSDCTYRYTNPHTTISPGQSKDFFSKTLVGPGQTCASASVKKTFTCNTSGTLVPAPTESDKIYKYISCRRSQFEEF